MSLLRCVIPMLRDFWDEHGEDVLVALITLASLIAVNTLLRFLGINLA